VATALRRDARENRDAILAATRGLFAVGGLNVPAREIAAEAGVGVGTLYRHFPTRCELVDAVLEEAFQAYIAAAEQALEIEDAWDGFVGYLETALELHAANRGLLALVETNEHGGKRVKALHRKLRPLLEQLVVRAQEQGALRADFRRQDFWLVFWSINRTIELTGDIAPDVWRRHLSFLLAGLHCSVAETVAEPALTDSQLQKVRAPR
jgi:AcrR family transcriptional regulator